MLYIYRNGYERLGIRFGWYFIRKCYPSDGKRYREFDIDVLNVDSDECKSNSELTSNEIAMQTIF